MVATPSLRAVELSTYAGARVRCDLAAPRDQEELAAVFAYCRERGRRATLRGSGLSFDGQALNTDLVISLEHFGGLSIDPERREAAAGAAVTWGALAEAALAHGCMPRVMVTTSEASVGGTLASNSFSRFSPARGKESAHIAGVDVVTTRGERLRCDRRVEADVLRGVIGGLGYLGAVTRVVHELDAGAPQGAETRVLSIAPIAAMLSELTPPFGSAEAGAWPRSRYGVLFPGLRRGLIYETRYLERVSRWRRYRLGHEPRSPLRVAGELLLRNDPVARLTWWLAARTVSPRPYVDPVLDHAFLMDGNLRTNRFGRRLGLAMRAFQQTFVMPAATTAELIAAAEPVLARRRLLPTLADVLYIPADGALLSSSRGLDGFAVSFAFETSSPPRLAAIRAAMRELASTCRGLGGRVHLTKNVEAAADDLAAMYADALPEFRRLKRRLDPDEILQNDFLRMNLPGLRAEP